MPPPIIDLSGGPETRGLAYGRAAGDRIRDGVAFYAQAFADLGLTRARRDEVTTQLLATASAFDEPLARELEAVARGAGVDVSDVLLLNARSEMVRIADEGCTAVACLPPATASGHTLLAQNWDWHPSRRATGVLLRIRPDDGPAVLTFTEAGSLGRCGLNEHGVGVVGNALQCTDGTRPGGVPVAFVRRRILASANVADAVAVVRAAPAGTSVNHLIAGAEGAAASCEVTVDGVYLLDPVESVLEHANHFRSPAAQAAVCDTGIARTPDTLARDVRIRTLVRATEAVTPDDLKSAFADHDGYPHSICRHAEVVDARTWVTVVSVVMDLDERRLWLAPGPVCRHRYEEVALVT
jgi:isopenicillin-N N-acyltransferase like protein